MELSSPRKTAVWRSPGCTRPDARCWGVRRCLSGCRVFDGAVTVLNLPFSTWTRTCSNSRWRLFARKSTFFFLTNTSCAKSTNSCISCIALSVSLVKFNPSYSSSRLLHKAPKRELTSLTYERTQRASRLNEAEIGRLFHQLYTVLETNAKTSLVNFRY